MRSKNKPAQTAAEREWVGIVAGLPCVICGAHGVHVHEPEQSSWFASMPLCPACHLQPDGWHGTRQRWKLRKRSELWAINETVRQVHQRLRASRPTHDRAAVVGEYYFEPMDSCPKSTKVQLLNRGGVATYGTWDGKDESAWLGWAPLPKIRKDGS